MLGFKVLYREFNVFRNLICSRQCVWVFFPSPRGLVEFMPVEIVVFPEECLDGADNEGTSEHVHDQI